VPVVAVAPAAAGAPAPAVVADGPSRRWLVWETVFVMVAFLVPSVTGAVVLLAQHVGGVADTTRFPDLIPGQPVVTMLLGILQYLQVAATVPIALLLLARTGITPRTLGLEARRFLRDVLPGLGLAAAGYGAEIPLILVVGAVLGPNSSLENKVPVGHVPGYYVVWGLAIAATTSVAEEVLVNGYLLTRLAQLGWSPRRALVLSLALRTSYHVYYGVGFLFTVPFGYLVTRSFQKHRSLSRPIAAHFLYDAVVSTIAILT
jgi:membrane protease YdiL (CAAX protease family)